MHCFIKYSVLDQRCFQKPDFFIDICSQLDYMFVPFLLIILDYICSTIIPIINAQHFDQIQFQSSRVPIIPLDRFYELDHETVEIQFAIAIIIIYSIL